MGLSQRERRAKAARELSPTTISAFCDSFPVGPEMFAAHMIGGAVKERDWLWLHSNRADWWP